MYQFPSTGILHFYIMNKMMNIQVTRYQFPSTGILHFYNAEKSVTDDVAGYQFPSTGILHFYGMLSEPSKIKAFRAYFCR